MGSELRQTLRSLLRQPLLAAAVIATLGLGLGANAAVFSLVHGILLKPLPFPEADRLVRLYGTDRELLASPNPRLQAIWNRLAVNYRDAADLRGRSETLAEIGLYEERTATLLVGEEPERLVAARVDAGLLPLLGVEPLLGRAFLPEEVEEGRAMVVLSHGLWRRVFGGSPEALGRSLRIDDEPHTVVGVMPPGFSIPRIEEQGLWTPLSLTEEQRQGSAWAAYPALGRLAPGVGLPAAQEEVQGIASGLLEMSQGGSEAADEAAADGGRALGLRLQPLLDSVVGDSRPLLALLQAAAFLVLLIACVNVSHLLLARAAAQRREQAIRRALGASRRHLLTRTLTESLLLGLAGGVLGLLLAAGGHRILVALIPAELPRTDAVTVDGAVLAFTLASSLLAALLCGLLPALAGLPSGGRREIETGGERQGRRLLLHDGFIVLEVALSLVLTVGAGLLAHSFLKLSAVDPGFETSGLVAQEVRLPAWRYGEEHRRAAFARELLDSLEGLPGVEAAALTTKLPFKGLSWVWGFHIAGKEEEDSAAGSGAWVRGKSASMKLVTPDYFRTLGVPIVQGRAFGEEDLPERGRVVMINETLARRHWPEGDAVGAEVVMSTGEERYKVVGVAADLRHDGLDAEPGELMYQPWSQGPAMDLFAVVAVRGASTGVAEALRRTVRQIDPALPLPPAAPLDELLERSLSTPRSRTALVGALAALALVLALLGTYAVMSFAVERRLPEIAVRMAVGASAARVRRMVLGRALAVTAAGIALGAAVAVPAGRLVQGMLFGVTALDPLTLTAAALLLAATALAAAALPARRAGRLDPVRLLRSD